MNWLSQKQQEAVDKLVAAGNRGIAWWKIGQGKTRIALDVYVQGILTRDGCEDKKLLVICSPQAVRQWIDERNLHPMPAHIPSIEFLSYALLSGPRGEGWARTIAGDDSIGMVVLDELWMYKNAHSRRTKNAHIISSRHPTVGLSGSMITNRNIEDLYGQAYAVGIGSVVAGSLTNFRSQFCISYEEYGLKFAPKKDALTTIQRRLAPFVDLHFPRDVRETKIQHITVDPTREQLKLFDTCQNDYYVKFKGGEELEIRSAATLITKLLQISDGAVRDNEAAVVSIKSNKFTRLLELLSEFRDAGERVIVWFAFKASLGKAYDFLGEEATCLSGDQKFDSEGWRKGRYSVALATIGSGASLNDFTNCQYSIIYSAPFNYLALAQAMGRTNRTGSRHTVCHYYFLSTAGGVDQFIYKYVRATGEVEEATKRTSADVIQQYYDKRRI